MCVVVVITTVHSECAILKFLWNRKSLLVRKGRQTGETEGKRCAEGKVPCLVHRNSDKDNYSYKKPRNRNLSDQHPCCNAKGAEWRISFKWNELYTLVFKVHRHSQYSCII